MAVPTLIALLAGCASVTRQSGSVISRPAVPKGTRYLCEGNRVFSADYQSSGATLYITGQALQLRPIQAASGAKYTDGAMTLWVKEDKAVLLFNDAPFYANCRAQR